MSYEAVLAFGVTLGVPIAVLVASMAQAKAAVAAMEAISRQPDMAGNIRGLLLLTLALIESLVIYCLIVFFFVQDRLAPVIDFVEMMGG
ncbi:MAG: hypothetical protein ACLFWB_04450 [Armatimonadota bacterium]